MAKCSNSYESEYQNEIRYPLEINLIRFDELRDLRSQHDNCQLCGRYWGIFYRGNFRNSLLLLNYSRDVDIKISVQTTLFCFACLHIGASVSRDLPAKRPAHGQPLAWRLVTCSFSNLPLLSPAKQFIES